MIPIIGLSVSQMTTDMFQLSCLMLSQSRPFPVHQLAPDFRKNNTMGATSGTGTD